MNIRAIKNILILSCLFVLFAVMPVLSQTPDWIDVVEGKSRVMKTDFSIEKVATGDPDICRALKTGDRELLINAKKVGKSNIIIWGPGNLKKEIVVNVKSRNIAAYAGELKDLLRDIEGVRVKIAGNRIVVEGRVFTKRSLQRIDKMLDGMPDVVNLVELSPLMKKIVKEEIEKALREEGMKNIRVKAGKNKFILAGRVGSKAAAERAEKIALAFSPDIINVIEVHTKTTNLKKIVKEEIEKALREEGMKNIRVKAGKNKFILAGRVGSKAAAERAEKIALAFSPDIINVIEVDTRKPYKKAVLIEMSLNVMEIERNVLRDMSIHWNPGGSLGAGGSFSSSTGNKPTLSGAITGTISSLFPKMRKIQEDGKGRSLMQQSLVTKSGGKAKFFAGSEIPVPVAQEGGTMSVEYKKVGVTLHFTPTLDMHNNVNSTIKIESSSVTGQGPGGAPIISSTRLDTVVSLKSGSSIALGGLIGQKDLASLSKSPPGGGYSLFQLNKGEREGRDAKEVMIFVTPRVLASSKEALREMGEKVEESFKEQELEKLREQMKKKKEPSDVSSEQGLR